eukprot:CAMPEP_0168420058 /NCGR_PEP_ID=MMETSP0228-20121227/32581_1 /TAXON_ID=133427 /ORGANISM="Protoceratium reticulatum, Strain CCCM 535 (=CCMP 1889)" /LENGTH=73 /DNA_ID=CAMNT_0008433945 /DNA_START=169 /DNA_END=390 /DNA_ORIENTATION=-
MADKDPNGKRRQVAKVLEEVIRQIPGYVWGCLSSHQGKGKQRHEHTEVEAEVLSPSARGLLAAHFQAAGGIKE